VSLILNADDFGASIAHNRGVMQAHAARSINSASLMMGEPGTTEAVAIARSTPSLPVGLHLALSDARPVSPPEKLPLLVGHDGRFPAGEDRLLRALLSVTGRRQLRLEIAAQFEAFHATGLPCNHVNSHRHVHQWPPIARLIFAEAVKWGVRTSRLPHDRLRARRIGDVAHAIRHHAARRIMRRIGITTIYESIGRDWTRDELLRVLQQLPSDGGNLIELYFHPVDTTTHPFANDLPALLDGRVMQQLSELRRVGIGKLEA
jgi:predicted glycoside hydrolase/deacetylase ChbG (UPF0249 family)